MSLRTERDGAVLHLVIDRPAAKNALTLAMRQDLERLCAEADADDAVAAVVLRAVGPVFCAGADIKEIAALGGALTPTNPGAALRAVRKPVICAVDGACVTGGLELALSCAWIVASDRAWFADTHARLGVLPRWGMSALLPRAVGIRLAKEMTATGRRLDAAEALRAGLVTAVVAPEELDAHVRGVAAAAAETHGAAVAASLALYDDGAGLGLDEALALERERALAWTPPDFTR
ncbi:MAG: enoyl-CoA hydratase [Streptomycetaceae bacterium]|nr:enoyl-CoA hydratase [Streptomycetaceae bacterium]